ncbi:hypothetical protein KG091_07900 [Carnobacteriaceae bacterium zg-ZUI78]|nr:hypothetical protein [Carnobacteriaceae bacterium zg-ZUI78]
MKKRRTAFHLLLPEDLKNELQKIADEKQLSLNALIRLMLYKQLKLSLERNR